MALLDPAGTVTDAGTLKRAELELSATAAPPGPAAALNLTVHSNDAPGPAADGLHDREVTVGEAVVETVITPPVAVTGRDVPSGNTAMGLLTATAAVAAPGVRVTVATATIPLAIVVEFMPYAMQVYAAGLPLQASDFPAAVADGLAAMLTDATAVEGYPSVHWSPVGSLPAGDANERFSVIVLPGAAFIDDSVNVDCASAALPNTRRIARNTKILL